MMVSAPLWAAAPLALGAGLYLLELSLRLLVAVAHWRRRRWERWVADWKACHPGRCAVCAFHRWGLAHGHEEPGSEPLPHICLETN